MSGTMVDDADEDDDVDPRVKDELEVLNFASAEINKLEREIDMARNKFRSLLSDSSNRLKLLSKKLGKCVEKARPYYELLKDFKMAEDELNKATVKFQRANGMYKAAKETVALAEERMTSRSEDEKPQFDSAWQEMMNHATMKFNESEKEKRSCEEQHQQRAAVFSDVQQNLRMIEKDIPRSITRAKPYFSLKDQLEGRLQAERQSVEDLQRALISAKETYRESLVTLEAISEEIHNKRKLNSLPPRTPGVGAESDMELQTDMLSINLDTQSVTSDVLPDECDVASLSSQDLLFDNPSPTDTRAFPATTAACSNTTTACNTPIKAVLSKPVPATQDPLSLFIREELVKPTFLAEKPPPPPQMATAHKLITLSQFLGGEGAIPKQQQQHSGANTDIQFVKNENITVSVDTQSLNHNSNNSSLHFENQILPKSYVAPQAKSSQNKSILSKENNVTSTSKNTSRGRPKDKRVQKLNPSHFPILQGLTDTNKRLSPKLPHGRPKGNDIIMPGHHHSPSPVRRAGSDYFIYPEPKLRQRTGVAREVSPGPNLFPDSDTSLFEKKHAAHSARQTNCHGHNIVNTTNVDISCSANITKCDDVNNQNTVYIGKNYESHNNANIGRVNHESFNNIYTNERPHVDGQEEDINIKHNNDHTKGNLGLDRMTDDGKLLYKL